jgi:hypothetical protein
MHWMNLAICYGFYCWSSDALIRSCRSSFGCLPTPSMRRPVVVKTVLVFLSVDPNVFTEPPLSHPSIRSLC